MPKIPKTDEPKVRLTAWVSPQMLRDVKHVAIERGTTVSALIVEILRAHLPKRPR